MPSDMFFYCEKCGNDEYRDHSREVQAWTGSQYTYNDWCEGCSRDAVECVKCNRLVSEGLEVEDKQVCYDCLDDLETCEDCGERILTPHTTTEYPRGKDGRFDTKAETIRCHDCHFHGSWREDE